MTSVLVVVKLGFLQPSGFYIASNPVSVDELLAHWTRLFEMKHPASPTLPKNKQRRCREKNDHSGIFISKANMSSKVYTFMNSCDDATLKAIHDGLCLVLDSDESLLTDVTGAYFDLTTYRVRVNEVDVIVSMVGSDVECNHTCLSYNARKEGPILPSHHSKVQRLYNDMVDVVLYVQNILGKVK